MAYLKLSFLIVYHIALLCFCQITSKKVIFTPEFCFVVCFLPQLIYALFYVEKWNFNLSIYTMFVYIIGVTTFVFGALLYKSYFLKKEIVNKKNNNINKIELSNSFLLLFLFFQMIAFVIVSQAIEQATGRTNLVEAIEMFGFLSKGSGIEMANIPGKMNMICYTSSFLWSYYLIHSLVYKYKSSKILLFLNLILSIVHHVVTGSRGGVIELIGASLIFWYLFRGESRNWEKIISFKVVFKGIVLAIFCLIGFRFSLGLLGRSATAGETISDYVARYLSAPLKNIDIKIRSGAMGVTRIFEWKTISSLLAFFSKFLGFDYSLILGDASTYMDINGFGLGNVYTIYYPMIQDLDFFGPIIFIFLMSIICEILFVHAMKTAKNESEYTHLRISVVIYGYVFSKLIFSFFSNRFYDNVISTGMIWCIIFWIMVKIGAENKIRNGKINISNRIILKLK